MISDKIPNGLRYCVYPIHINAGKIMAYEGMELLRKDPAMVIFSTTKPIGAEVQDTGSFAQIVALAHFVYNSKTDCISIINKIHDIFRVLDPGGKNLIDIKLPEKDLLMLNL